MIDNKRVIITMTSWKKRIDNVSHVVFSLLKNSCKPDLIICNLSTDEFPNKEKDLPNDLLMLQQTTCFEIHWVKENTKTFKKMIPTLKENYAEDYFLFTADDDELYDECYIETGIKNLKKYDVVVITKRSETSTGVWGGLTCYNSKIFESQFWTSLTTNMIDTGMDDEYINAYLRFKKIPIFCCQEKHTSPYKPIFPNRGKGYTKSEILKAKSIAESIFC